MQDVQSTGGKRQDVQSAASKPPEAKKPVVAPQPPTANAKPAAPKSEIRNQKSEIEFVDDRYESSVEEFDPFAGEAFEMIDPFMDEAPAPRPDAPQKPSSLVRESTADYAVRTPRAIVPEAKTAAEAKPTQSPAPVAAPRYESTPAPKTHSNGHNGNGHSNGHSQGNGNGHKTGNGNGYTRGAPQVRTAKVIISRSGDGPTDAQRVGEVHQAMSSCPGPDKFCFIIMARGGMYQMDFPNDSTTLNDELITYLKSMPGVESVQVSMM